MRALVTGCGGFVGQALSARLVADGWEVRAAVRVLPCPAALPAGVVSCRVGEISPTTSWNEALEGADAIFHLAARVHMMRDDAVDPAAEYDRVNRQATAHLARQAVQAGVPRFVFVSSAKVMGEGRDVAYTEDDVPGPQDPYAASKLAAEKDISEISRGTAMRVAVLRPPLMYGPGVKANFLRLIRAVERGIPLPLGAVTNQRSLLGVDNLVDAMVTWAMHPAAMDGTWMVSDGVDLSSSTLVRAIAKALGRPARLWRVPPRVLQVTARMVGREAAATRLLGSFVVDSRRIRRELDWTPPVSFEEGLARTVAWYRSAAPR